MATKDETQIPAQLTTLIFLSKHYQFLSESRITDFFTKELFEKLPEIWKKLLSEIKIQDFGKFLDLDNSFAANQVWPLSFLTLRKLIQTNCLPRQQHSIPFQTNGYLTIQSNPKKTVCCNSERLKYTFTKHVKPKKRYEIEEIALETAKLAEETEVKYVIDVGSGVGHLSRALSYGYGLSVVGVETQVNLIKRAKKWDEELEKSAGKILDEREMEKVISFRPHHRVMNISFETTSEDLEQMIQEISGGRNNFGIVGLHPCGNLAPILLKIFSKCETAKFIILASCCYHRMYHCDNGTGFPMSRFLNNVKILGADAAAWACHAIEVSSKRLKTGDYDYLKIHCFRAALEQIIQQEWPEHVQKSLNSVTHYPELTFKEYCDKALTKLNVTVSENQIKSKQVIKNLASWKNVVFYHALCILLAPVTETVFQLDRLLYLTEEGIPSQLRAVFDPVVSPRNYILTAKKPKKNHSTFNHS